MPQIFFSSEKYVRKLQNNVRSIDISKLVNKYMIWKYIWKTEDFGNNISTELNNKRNTFLHMIKTAFEVVMTTKSKLFQHKFLIKISKCLTNTTLHSDEFVFIKNTMFVILASMMKKNQISITIMSKVLFVKVKMMMMMFHISKMKLSRCLMVSR